VLIQDQEDHTMLPDFYRWNTTSHETCSRPK